MDRPRAGFTRNFGGTQTPPGKRPALLPSPVSSQATSSMYSLPPPNLANTYPQINSNQGGQPIPNYNVPVIPMDPNARPNVVQPHQGKFKYL